MADSNQFTQNTVLDYLFDFASGMNSGVAPLLLQKNELGYASNATLRGTFIQNRPPWNDLTLSYVGNIKDAVELGLWQGATYYKPDNGPEALVASISGRLFYFVPNGPSATVTEVTGGNPQSPIATVCWLWQAENYVIWNDGSSLPVFFNGTTTTRSVGNVNVPVAMAAGIVAIFIPPAPGVFAITLVANYPGSNGDIVQLGSSGLFQITAGAGTTNITCQNVNIPSGFYSPPFPIFSTNFKPQFPAGRMGAYGLGRIWMVLTDGKQFVAGDIVGGPSGTLALNYRDAILNITENQYLYGGGFFTVPGSAGEITAMLFTATLDVSLGQGPLQVFTPTKVFSCQTPVDRATWSTITNPILTESLISNGGLGQNSTIQASGDSLFRSVDGIRSLILARRAFSTWGNVPISREMDRSLLPDDEALLPFSSAVVFDNRMLMTLRPTAASAGVYHQGLIVLNFDPISSLRGKAPSIYDGTWPGLNALQLTVGNFALVERCYTFTFNPDSKRIGLREVLNSKSTQFADNFNADPIVWWFESSVLDFGSKDPRLRKFLRLINGEIYVDQLVGTVKFTAQYRPDQWPCWVPWIEWSQCSTPTGDNVHPGFQPRMGLGEPSGKLCDTYTNRPFREGYTFQFKLIVSGKCRILGAKFMAVVLPDPTFAKPACDAICS